MYSSFPISKRLVSVPILAVVTIQILFIRSGFSLNQTNAYLHHKCINSQGTYKSRSPYEENLNRVVRSISTGNLRSGFAHVSNGDTPNTVFVKLQCRGDSYWSKCHSCLATAISGLRKRCPNNKGGIIWYDNCLLEISSIDTLGKIDYKNNFYMYNAKEVSSDIESFNKNVRILLNKLKEKATSNETNAGRDYTVYAAGDNKLGPMKLYAMVQCTQDLSTDGCNECLNYILTKLPKCCIGKQGGRVLSTSCNFRYELYPFVKT
ncbi:PREDICTED: putative cysteine-rich repeat secretory protein 21 [Camelina sativa]|uniref:Cysteine-rich repeat secretory protein 21 n=1 Tax=Camelina sativa TaxID=90675 RepID=A0ABM0W6P9_CAMSA|nr:PREDICTED: putative cysteine-rich repeat secretory protein 21 [Camelina sativa]